MHIVLFLFVKINVRILKIGHLKMRCLFLVKEIKIGSNERCRKSKWWNQPNFQLRNWSINSKKKNEPTKQ